ncbi:conserved hypothetical protein [Paenibacillus curdlanolyticus YK9]|uniref:Uncharacterized protein n=1 Tax=Paenibacillus curdlanolyticus YK9 TaxID=717606 RepID=E0IA30_9BACL|nr:hypothetical protein [Paenibacillus curdlanolyticus]EFM10607.1 conserved hypothetical protein [Paenibacillus curdlanolyticus YK9]
MDLYHSWIYMKVINTSWFMWSLVSVVLGLNLLTPLIIWYIINRKRLTKFMQQAKARKKQTAR